ncbi:type IV secretory system conjugative DNA transfer family protein [Streptomyces sp. NPDC050848]|uniref:type IV secretory system conjugative DNA transfer family protein n=1 Tax=Streptomyces sp. NPDC050848 TaxID=3155791 RepID=UPI0033E6E940
MSANTTTVSTSSTERAVAVATTAAPIVTGILAPLLDGGAAFTAAIAYGATGGFLAANYMNRLPPGLAHHLPAGDIVRAHRVPLFISTLTSGMALGLGTLGGLEGTDALMAGIVTMPSIPGIVSLGWWAAVALVPLKLRNVLRRPRTGNQHTQTPQPGLPGPVMPDVPLTDAQRIAYAWYTHISHPAHGTHRGQELTLRTHSTDRWTGTVTAPTGSSVTVKKDTISSVYKVDASWIDLTPGAHAGELHLTVNLTPPPTLDEGTLAGAWAKYVARKGGLMAGTYLTDVQDDPNTGGQVAVVVADDTLDKLTHPDRSTLAGALRTTPLLISYEPRLNPREAVVRKMDHNPLEEGTQFPGAGVLKVNENGYIQIGRGISGFPARIQLFDPKLGAQHVLVAGVTGSGKGGTLQLIALAHHVNGSAIINADPKGSSNPAIDAMAAYSGLGPDGAIGALRVWYHGLQHRIAESARLGMKNFQPSADRPWVPLILDEASKLLGEKAEHKKEAVFIINAGATLGRSLGMPVIIANQLMQLAQFGGDPAIRDNIFYGGSLVLLRSDSQQKHLIDLPDNFAGCNPADIPPAWSEDRALVFDADLPENDPVRTFGLGFAASPGAHAEMMRNWLLEDATPHIDTTQIAHPADWPFWDQRDELARYSVLPEDQEDGEEGGGGAIFDMGSLSAPPKKPKTADDKILQFLEEYADPIAEAINYAHKDQIADMTRIEGSTLDNALSRLSKAGKIHRQTENGKELRGWYGLGPTPNPAPASDDQPE